MIENIISTNNHYTVVHFLDFEMGNPNGDPDTDNQPRMDPWGYGFLTDACIKRKLRDTIKILHGHEEGYEIFVDNDQALNSKMNDRREKSKSKTGKTDTNLQNRMREDFWDIRMFGAVMSTGGKDEDHAGTVTQGLQVVPYRSLHVIDPQEVTITRKAVTTEKDFEKGNVNTIGKKWIVPYALYQGFMHFNCQRAELNKITPQDLQYLWEAIPQMFDINNSAARGLVTTQKLFVFKQSGPLYHQQGKLKKLIKTSIKDGIDCPRSFEDFNVTVDYDNIPNDVELFELI